MLESNARTRNTTLAAKTGLTEGAIRLRVRRLENAGIILGYRAVLGPGAGDAKDAMIALIGVEPASGLERERFERALRELPGLQALDRTYAPDGYAIRARTPDLEQILRVMALSAGVEIIEDRCVRVGRILESGHLSRRPTSR